RPLNGRGGCAGRRQRKCDADAEVGAPPRHYGRERSWGIEGLFPPAHRVDLISKWTAPPGGEHGVPPHGRRLADSGAGTPGRRREMRTRVRELRTRLRRLRTRLHNLRTRLRRLRTRLRRLRTQWSPQKLYSSSVTSLAARRRPSSEAALDSGCNACQASR